jgi:hypothetical protein
MKPYRIYGLTLEERLKAAKDIVASARGTKYNLIGKGEGSWFESFTANYQYLLWWLGNEPTKQNQKLKFILEETQNGIKVTKIKR